MVKDTAIVVTESNRFDFDIGVLILHKPVNYVN